MAKGGMRKPGGWKTKEPKPWNPKPAKNKMVKEKVWTKPPKRFKDDEGAN